MNEPRNEPPKVSTMSLGACAMLILLVAQLVAQLTATSRKSAPLDARSFIASSLCQSRPNQAAQAP